MYWVLHKQNKMAAHIQRAHNLSIKLLNTGRGDAKTVLGTMRGSNLSTGEAWLVVAVSQDSPGWNSFFQLAYLKSLGNNHKKLQALESQTHGRK